jgi:hypothetical protein
VLDNLKEGVAVPDLYDPTINPLFRDVRPSWKKFVNGRKHKFTNGVTEKPLNSWHKPWRGL